MSTNYVFAGSDLIERQLRCISETFDEATARTLGKTGIGPGWRCLEVGAGNGSVAGAMAAMSGPRGHVMATDIDIGHLRAADGVQVRRHDIVQDPLPEGHYDLIHARLLLMHLPQRRAVVERLTRALRPGGWLVTEDYDLSGRLSLVAAPYREASGLVAKAWNGLRTVLSEAGVDLAWGGQARHAFTEAGLTDVCAEAIGFSGGPGSPGRELVPIAIEQLGPRLISAGLLTADELGSCLAALRAPHAIVFTPPYVVTLGCRKGG
ncbi:methyltransferase domain-containing protein [Actinomadura sp. NPDC000600]|uniref:methyltransferase domain-containing protein n=1 Tax=Actinomadura sp. NPDC000600 TaxID=3154262 RepID=UPI0033969CDF